MAIVVPNASEILWLNHVLNKTAPEDQVLKLYTNIITIDEFTTASSFTEATGGGYSNKPITGTSWAVTKNANDEGEGTFVAQVFTFTGALTGNPSIRGYFVVETTSGLLLWAETRPDTFTPVNNGDALTVNLRIQLFSEN